jgi:hypothetical protein
MNSVKRLFCRWFGHQFTLGATGLWAVNRKPVFGCTRCYTEWIVAEGEWSDQTFPTKRDHFTRYRCTIIHQSDFAVIVK